MLQFVDDGIVAGWVRRHRQRRSSEGWHLDSRIGPPTPRHSAKPVKQGVLFHRSLGRAHLRHVLGALVLLERRLRARPVVVKKSPSVAPGINDGLVRRVHGFAPIHHHHLDVLGRHARVVRRRPAPRPFKLGPVSFPNVVDEHAMYIGVAHRRAPHHELGHEPGAAIGMRVVEQVPPARDVRPAVAGGIARPALHRTGAVLWRLELAVKEVGAFAVRAFRVVPRRRILERDEPLGVGLDLFTHIREPRRRPGQVAVDPDPGGLVGGRPDGRRRALQLLVRSGQKRKVKEEDGRRRKVEEGEGR